MDLAETRKELRLGLGFIWGVFSNKKLDRKERERERDLGGKYGNRSNLV